MYMYILSRVFLPRVLSPLSPLSHVVRFTLFCPPLAYERKSKTVDPSRKYVFRSASISGKAKRA